MTAGSSDAEQAMHRLVHGCDRRTVDAALTVLQDTDWSLFRKLLGEPRAGNLPEPLVQWVDECATDYEREAIRNSRPKSFRSHPPSPDEALRDGSWPVIARHAREHGLPAREAVALVEREDCPPEVLPVLALSAYGLAAGTTDIALRRAIRQGNHLDLELLVRHGAPVGALLGLARVLAEYPDDEHERRFGQDLRARVARALRSGCGTSLEHWSDVGELADSGFPGTLDELLGLVHGPQWQRCESRPTSKERFRRWGHIESRIDGVRLPSAIAYWVLAADPTPPGSPGLLRELFRQMPEHRPKVSPRGSASEASWNQTEELCIGLSRIAGHELAHQLVEAGHLKMNERYDGYRYQPCLREHTVGAHPELLGKLLTSYRKGLQEIEERKNGSWFDESDDMDDLDTVPLSEFLDAAVHSRDSTLLAEAVKLAVHDQANPLRFPYWTARAALRLAEVCGPQAVKEAFSATWRDGPSARKVQLKPFLDREVLAPVTTGGGAVLDNLRHRVTECREWVAGTALVQELCDRVAEHSREDAFRASEVIRSHHAVHWPSVLAIHGEDPIPPEARAQLLQHFWSVTPEAAETLLDRQVVDLLARNDLGAGLEVSLRSLDFDAHPGPGLLAVAIWNAPTRALREGSPARHVLAGLPNGSSDEGTFALARCRRAIAALAAEHLADAPESAWLVIHRLLPTFEGTVAELLTTARAVATAEIGPPTA